ncbi:galactoside alpha-(1,2)-fucosyltransferase 2 isoform X1 [Dendroctonus ponderosae]|uniref:galactoside alpha-(1,2)-fucosyltransferase 2 isoform X1 n=1 Tax=Dendroctonus ponderosae TaxID=77166 RepID=UPI002035A00B|nr:galactoside alpha-(1,2)-fucosyltransferase 2 isoform X1 [Dendroctonus ponderosae]
MNRNTKFFRTLILLVLLVTLMYIAFPLHDVPSKQQVPHVPGKSPLSDSVQVRNISAANVSFTYTYRDLEFNLCKEAKKWTSNSDQDKKKSEVQCPRKAISSVVFIKGRTGNQMWEYASVWAVARRTGLEPYVPRCIRNRLKEIFDMLTVPGFEDIAHCPVEFKTFVNSIEEWTSTNQSIILPRYTLQPELVLTWVQDIRQEFHFNKEIRNKAQRVLLDLSRKLPRKEYTFVGVHVRRTDYQGYLDRKYGEKLVTKAFFINAMNYFNSKYSNCLFIYVSDDPGWCSKQFGRMKNVFVASNENSPAEDMAILSYCNHTIYDYGTFGEWGALLAGGETIYLNMTQNMRKGTGKFMNWIPMK